jgi:hypothetical protein
VNDTATDEARELPKTGKAESRPCEVELEDRSTDEEVARPNCPYLGASGSSKSLSDTDSVACDAVDEASEWTLNPPGRRLGPQLEKRIGADRVGVVDRVEATSDVYSDILAPQELAADAIARLQMLSSGVGSFIKLSAMAVAGSTACSSHRC